MAVRANFDGPLSPSAEMTAAELIKRIRDGQQAFSDIRITDDFTWDSVTRGDWEIQGNLSLSKMVFAGECHIGDLRLSGDLFLAGSTFMGRSALYRITASGICAQSTCFERGAALLNSRSTVTDFLGARFPGDVHQPPTGLLIKHTAGDLLRLNEVVSVQTILEHNDFQTIMEDGAELGCRTSLTLGELTA